MNNLIKVGITQGDFNGVGPEVIIRALAGPEVCDLFTPVLFADWRVIDQARRFAETDLAPLNRIESAAEAVAGKINVVDLRLPDLDITPGIPTTESGAASVEALERAVEALKEKQIDVLVTAPISKMAVQSEIFSFPGHTEYLNHHAGADFKSQMILFDDYLRVALVTTHLPIAKIPEALTQDKIVEAAAGFSRTLRQDFGIERPKIAILSLNPHCGDGGLLGSEESETIIPAIDRCIAEGILAFGPYAADGFFGSGAYRDFDGVIAMYHDQGLAPFKALAREHGVNFTAGLPFVRTSPDHGTAFDIAWSGKADPTSMREAIYKAIDILRCRRSFAEASANPLKVRPQSLPKPERERHPKSTRPDAGNKAHVGETAAAATEESAATIPDDSKS